jgi:hypothetical protein
MSVVDQPEFVIEENDERILAEVQNFVDAPKDCTSLESLKVAVEFALTAAQKMRQKS